ncbi:MAG: AAA family ATPase [Gammaproteobacteria bacterium]|nr:AAA family ATPase [Gammaproteobacteria bacterium]
MQTLMRALQNPSLYDHPVTSFSIMETHISWIVLTGQFAYKFKKAVNFGFIDFSTLEKRKFYCDEELRLNRRFAPELYLKTVAIRGSYNHPRFGGNDEVIEYAVKMREFPQECLFSRYADEHRLKSEHINSMASVIANFHSLAPCAAAGSPLGDSTSILKWSNENFQHIERIIPDTELPGYYLALKTWFLKEQENLIAVIRIRQTTGFIRECHGDLHLGNMTLIDNRCMPFDCIEFNEELRWIDTISEVAFVVMDLLIRGYHEYAWLFLNRYLAICGDYSGLAMLPYYVIYRALVRAKVEALSLSRSKPDFNQCLGYLDLAHAWTQTKQPVLITMHGLSGSGKSTVAEHTAMTLGAIHIRSDIERKRLFDLDARSESESKIGEGIYDKEASQQTYQHLVKLAENLLDNGFIVIVDAACLNASQRDLFRQLALKNRVPRFLISCQASQEALYQRVKLRQQHNVDPSEANAEVLENQIRHQQPLSTAELDSANTIICNSPQLSTEQLKKISHCCARPHSHPVTNSRSGHRA